MVRSDGITSRAAAGRERACECSRLISDLGAVVARAARRAAVPPAG